MAKKENQPQTSPTGPGLILIVVLFAMLLASINYGNNMAYILCFLLSSLMMVTFLYTRNNLKGLEIANVISQPVFAGDTLHFTFELHNRTRGRRLAIYAMAYGDRAAEGFAGPLSVEPLSRTTGKVSIEVPRRGRLVLSHITVLTLYPLGLFRVRQNLRVNKVYIVYPKPMGDLPWPEPEVRDDDATEGFYARGGDDFVGVRPYREGESMHHVDWKAVARGRPLAIKEFTGGGTHQQWFAWEHLGAMDMEQRLSQLTRWVLEADQEGKEFGLRLPGTEINHDSSPGHTVKCLEKLAVYSYAPGGQEPF
jgi:uncharacterized protein (DUF58 family)